MLFSQGRDAALPEDFRLPKALESLDPEEPILVLGSPGSGKTSLLRQLAKDRIQRFGASSTLAITPSRTSAAELRDQLVLDSSATSNGPRSRSLSSLAFWILDEQAQRNGSRRPKLLSGANQQELIKKLVSEAICEKRTQEWAVPRQALELQGFASELRDQITVLLEHQLTQEQVRELQLRYPNLRLGPAIDLFPRYLKSLEELELLDASQLIVEAVRVLEQDRTVIEGLRYFLVDDAQELTAAGLALIGSLSKTATGYFFADPDATVLGFRGAVGAKLVEALQQFSPQIQRVTLDSTHSVRPTEIAELMRKASNRIAVSLSGVQRKNLNAEQSDPESVVAKVFPNSSQELDFVATEIRKIRIQQKLTWDSFVVIARTRPQLEAIQKGLISRSVPCRIVGSQSALRDQFAARSILDIALQILEPNGKDVDFIKSLLLSPFCGLDSLGIRRLVRRLSYLERESGLRRPLQEILKEAIDTAAAADLETTEFIKLRKLQNLIRKVREKTPKNGHELISEIWSASDLPSNWLALSRGNSEVAGAANQNLDSVLELFAAAQRFTERNPASSALEFVKYQLDIAVPEDSLAPIGYSPAVTLATPSALIGRRFDYGFLPRLQDGIWPNLKARSSLLGAVALDEFLKGNAEDPTKLIRTELSEELRLLYKSIGCIGKRIFLTAMTSVEEQPSPFFNILFSDPIPVETFEREFDLRHRVGRLRVRVQQGDQQAALELATLAKAGVAGADPAGWYGFLDISSDQPLATSEEEVVVNPSKLEAFEKCPLHWFVSAHGGDGSGFEASLGTLIHEALEQAKNDSDQLGPIVDSLWHELEFEAEWQERAQKRKAQQMVQALTEYIQSKSGELIASEAAFEFIVGRLKIDGKVDRLEKTSEGVVVVDLKTGRVGTKEEVQHNKQLAIYQLAAQTVLTPEEKVVGAKIISVNQKLSTPVQGPLDGELRKELEALLSKAELGMSGTSLAAVVSDHCDSNSQCSMLLVRQVTQLG